MHSVIVHKPTYNVSAINIFILLHQIWQVIASTVLAYTDLKFKDNKFRIHASSYVSVFQS